MDFLLTEDFSFPSVGETREGWVIENRENEILIDIGAKSEGVITGSELQELDESMRQELAVGNKVVVYIVDTEDRHGNIVVSFTKAAAERDWVLAEKLLESQDVYQGQIIGRNRGGLLVKLGLLRGFVPNSQLSRMLRASNSDDEEANQQDEHVGKTIGVKVIEVDRNRNRLILSEKAARQEKRQARRAEILASLQEGDIHEGRVINLADFGAFVDIGGVEGLVHLSELSWKRIGNPGDVLKVGDHIKVCVLNVDQERERLALSIKQLEPDPWTLIDEYYQVGQLIEATVTKLTKYGAFARLHDDYELEGLIHISEISENHINHPSELLKSAQKVTVRIIRIDPDQRQLGLSLKQVVSDQFVEADLEMMSAVQA